MAHPDHIKAAAMAARLAGASAQRVARRFDLSRTAVRRWRDPEWLRRQSARDLAMLHGTMFDQMMRLFGALRPGTCEEI